MNNIIRNTVFVGIFATSMIAMADTPAKKAATTANKADAHAGNPDDIKCGTPYPGHPLPKGEKYIKDSKQVDAKNAKQVDAKVDTKVSVKARANK